VCIISLRGIDHKTAYSSSLPWLGCGTTFFAFDWFGDVGAAKDWKLNSLLPAWAASVAEDGRVGPAEARRTEEPDPDTLGAVALLAWVVDEPGELVAVASGIRNAERTVFKRSSI
jgi:hypothetical protein